MAAFLDDVPVPAKTMKRITGLIAEARAINAGKLEFTLYGSADLVAPPRLGGIPCPPGSGVFADQSFASLFPSIGDQGYFWVYCDIDTIASVSHA